MSRLISSAVLAIITSRSTDDGTLRFPTNSMRASVHSTPATFTARGSCASGAAATGPGRALVFAVGAERPHDATDVTSTIDRNPTRMELELGARSGRAQLA